MSERTEWDEHKKHVFWKQSWCRFCQRETKREAEAEELEKVRELHGRMADAYNRGKAQ